MTTSFSRRTLLLVIRYLVYSSRIHKLCLNRELYYTCLKSAELTKLPHAVFSNLTFNSTKDSCSPCGKRRIRIVPP
jgi:hypothetical protein